MIYTHNAYMGVEVPDWQHEAGDTKQANSHAKSIGAWCLVRLLQSLLQVFRQFFDERLYQALSGTSIRVYIIVERLWMFDFGMVHMAP